MEYGLGPKLYSASSVMQWQVCVASQSYGGLDAACQWNLRVMSFLYLAVEVKPAQQSLREGSFNLLPGRYSAVTVTLTVSDRLLFACSCSFCPVFRGGLGLSAANMYLANASITSFRLSQWTCFAALWPWTNHGKLARSTLYSPLRTKVIPGAQLSTPDRRKILIMAGFFEPICHLLARMVLFPLPPRLYHLLICAVVSLALIQAYHFVHQDYHNFLSLGPGGTPSTLQGYLRVTWLRLYAHKNPFLPPPLTPEALPSSGYLLRLPQRSGQRPRVAGIAPHRQLDQRPSPAIFVGMERALHLLAETNPTRIRIGTSAFEKHGLALFLTYTTALQYPHSTHLNETCRHTGEICHIHDTVSLPLTGCENLGRCSIYVGALGW